MGDFVGGKKLLPKGKIPAVDFRFQQVTELVNLAPNHPRTAIFTR
jgi:hypothetical protein